MYGKRCQVLGARLSCQVRNKQKNKICESKDGLVLSGALTSSNKKSSANSCLVEKDVKPH